MSARIRTGYSFRRAAGKLEDVIARIKGIGLPTAPITDSTTFGWSRWSKLAPEAGLRPVYGVEIAVDVSRARARDIVDTTKHKPATDQWLFLASKSVVPLHQLIAKATEQFYYEPTLTIQQALSVPDLFVIAGHRFDPAQIPQLGPNHPNFFVGLSPACSHGFIRRVLARNLPFVATGVNRYPEPHQRALYEVVAGKNSSIQTYPQHILSDQEWRAWVPAELADHAWETATPSSLRASPSCRVGACPPQRTCMTFGPYANWAR